MRFLAIVRLVEVIGEAATRVPREFQEAHPTVPWQDIIGMRHRLIHGYDAIDLDVLWNVVHDDLPALVASLEALE